MFARKRKYKHKVKQGLRSAVAIAASLALAFSMLPLAAIPQVAWADNEENVSVVYMRVGEDSYYGIDPTYGDDQAYTDYRDEVEVHATFDRNLGQDLSGNPKAGLCVKGQFKLHPQNGGEDVVVLDGSSTVTYGNDRIFYGYEGSSDGPGNSIVSASFLFPETIQAGVYTLVMDLQFNTSNTYFEDFEDNWTAVQHCVTTDTLEVRRGDKPRPQVEPITPKMVYSGQKYHEQLVATPSSPGNTIKWTCSLLDPSNPSAGTDLDPYGLQLNEDGTITGKAKRVDYSQLFDFFATATEYNGNTKVGTTSRKIKMYITEQPVIVTYSADFSRGAAGIAPGSKIALQMRLSSESFYDKAKAVIAYKNGEGNSATNEVEFEQSDKSGRAYAGEASVPANAKSIQSITFKANSIGAVEDKVVEIKPDEQSVAPGLAVKVLKAGSSDELAVLSEGMSSPFVRLTPQGGGQADASTVWLDTWGNWNDEAEIQDSLSFETPAGTYDAQLFAYVDGREQEVAGAQTVTLAAGEVADELVFEMGAFTRVEPKVQVNGSSAENDLRRVSYDIEWYSDENCQNRIATSETRSWDNATDTWARAVPNGRSRLDYISSDAVKLTAENTENITLNMLIRDTASVTGTVTKAMGSDAVDLSTLTATLKVGSGWYARTFTGEVQSDGSYSFTNVPMGGELDAVLSISAPQIYTVERAVADLSNIGNTEVTLRQGVIGLMVPVDYADVETSDGTHLSATVSNGKRYIYLDDPSAVTQGDELKLRLY